MPTKHHNLHPGQDRDGEQPGERSKVTLDEALQEKYPKAVLDAINKVRAEEILEWEASSFGIRFMIRRGTCTLALRARLTVRRLLALLTGTATIITIISASPNLAAAWDALVTFAQNITSRA